MKRVLPVFGVFWVFLSVAGASPAPAQRHAGHCDHIKSSAEAMDCINRHLQEAQAELNNAFGSTGPGETEALKGAANKAQQAWLAYRDGQCAWEAAQADPPALARMHELSCHTALTEARTSYLGAMTGGDGIKAGPPEFGARPRWMNVLAEERPGVFWNYDRQVRTDLDCDGTDEDVMAGLAVAPWVGEEAVTLFGARIVLAAVENPAAGKPSARFFELLVAGEGEGLHVCGIDIGMMPVERENLPVDQACRQALRITDDLCDAALLYWDGKDYRIEKESVAAATKMEKQ